MIWIKRFVGLLITVAALAGIVLGIAGVLASQAIVAGIDSSTDGLLGAIDTSVSSAKSSILLVRDTLAETSVALETVEQSALDVSVAISSTEPVFNDVAVVLSENVPASVEAIQLLIPNLITVTSTIDTALLTLSEFDLNESFLGQELQLPEISVGFTTLALPPIRLPTLDLNFDLGIEYSPNVDFETSLTEIEGNLDGIPQSIRALSTSLEETAVNIDIIGRDVELVANDIADINLVLKQVPEQLDSYVVGLDEASANIEDLIKSFDRQLTTIENSIVVFFVWIALTHLAPLYVGLTLLFSRSVSAPAQAVDE